MDSLLNSFLALTHGSGVKMTEAWSVETEPRAIAMYDGVKVMTRDVQLLTPDITT